MQPAPILTIPTPNGVPPYLRTVIVAAILATLVEFGIHVQAPDAPTEPDTTTECECECATPAPTPDLTTEPQVGTEV